MQAYRSKVLTASAAIGYAGEPWVVKVLAGPSFDSVWLALTATPQTSALFADSAPCRAVLRCGDVCDVVAQLFKLSVQRYPHHLDSANFRGLVWSRWLSKPGFRSLEPSDPDAAVTTNSKQSALPVPVDVYAVPGR